ncbi:MAG: molybdate ABC transporter permease subunit [Pseudomonadota bacterium]
MSVEDLQALWLTLKLATSTTFILLVIGLPLSWWLVRSQSLAATVVNVLIALPLVLPPTVIGFYLLIAMGPSGPLGALTSSTGLAPLAFSFPGLVFGSVIYSLPFVIQPLQAGFASVPQSVLDASNTLGADSKSLLLRVAIPLSQRAVVVASVLGFAHTVGEFGVVLMIGGNIPGETRVASVQIYDHVEALDYASAHQLSLVLVIFSLVVLTAVYRVWGRSVFTQSRHSSA